MDSHIKSKLPETGTTIFTVMSALAAKHKAINLSQGFPDFSGSPLLVSLVNRYMKKGFNQYAPMAGLMELREAISAKVEKLYGKVYDPADEITVTPGATEAIYSAITAVVNEGDEVLIFEPAYDCYAPAVKLNGGVAVYAELKYPQYTPDWVSVRNLINRNTRMIIINSPHNPTGAVLGRDDMEALEKLTAGTGIFILSDEVYEHIIFDGQRHESAAKYPLLAERSFIVFSFGKTFHNTGWKIGYCLAPALLMAEFRKIHQFIVFSANTPIQYALAEFLKDESSYAGLAELYQGKRDYFLSLIARSRFNALPARGTYFQVLGYPEVSSEKDTELAERITVEHKVASIPVSVFYHNRTDHKALRFCFAKSEETLEKAAMRLCRI